MEKEILLNIANADNKLKSNTLFSLQNKEEVFYYLAEGQSDIFYIEKKDGDYGKRNFIARIEAPFLIPSSPMQENYDIVINTSSETEVVELDKISINEISKKNIDEFSGLINSWIDKMANRINKYGMPSLFTFSDTQKNITVKKGSVFCPPNFDEIIWFDLPDTSIKLFDKYEIKSDKKTYLPSAKNFWYQFYETAEINQFSTEEIIQKDSFTDYLFYFNKEIDKILNSLHTEYLQDSLNQINVAAKYKEKTKANAIYNLKEIIPGEKSTEQKLFVDHIDNSLDLLFKACSIVGEYEKIEFKKPKPKKNSKLTQFQMILKTSNIRSRKVNLDFNWQNSFHGALLGFWKEDKTPVALIPKNNSSYYLIDIQNHTKTIVNEDIATKLLPYAYSFYTPLPKKKITGKDMMKFALKFTYKDIIAFFIIGIAAALLALLLPISVGYIFNNVIPSGSTPELLQIAILLVSVAIVMAILNFAKSIAILRAQGTASYKLQSAIWDRILSLEVNFFRKYNPGDLAERSMGIEQIKESISNVVIHSLVSAIFSVFYFALLFYYSWELAIFALFLGLIIVAFTITISFFAYKYIVQIKRMEAIISGFLLQILSGINKIRITDSKDSVFALWTKKFAKQKENYVAKRKLLVWAAVFTSIFPVFGSMVIFIKVHSLFTHSLISMGDFLAFNTAFGSFQGALLQMAMATVPFITIKPTFDLIRPILTAAMEADDKQDPGDLNGNIEVSHINFKYEDNQDLILKDVSLKMKAGQFVALVGSSGSGKSTLMRILLGFEKYASGSIFFDGKEISDINIRDLREQLGVVLQNSKIMQGSILFNIIGNSTLTEEDAWRAAKMAGCDKDIENLPQKMQTILPAGGGTLSGGQQQRIIIARALVRNPKIFIFDEATSALDNETQKIVSDYVNKLNATRIVIAHRLSTIKDADIIFVMDNGKVVEQGNYEELMVQKGFFENLAKRQLA